MAKQNPVSLLKLWAALTLLAVILAVYNLLYGHFYFMITATAIMMLLVLTYQYISYRIDGSNYGKSFDDERLSQISAMAFRNSSSYFFIIVWLLAAALNFSWLDAAKPFISLVLALVVLVGFIIHAASFAWYKYHI